MATGLNQSSDMMQGSKVSKQSGDIQIEQTDSRTPEQKAPTKRRIFTAPKQDLSLVESVAPSQEEGKPMFDGVDAMIDGYYRINKRKYVSRGQYKAR